MESFTVKSTLAPNILTITPPGESEVIRIAPDGKLFWRGREVETDTDFRAAMLECAGYLSGKKRPPDVPRQPPIGIVLGHIEPGIARVRWMDEGLRPAGMYVFNGDQTYKPSNSDGSIK